MPRLVNIRAVLREARGHHPVSCTRSDVPLDAIHRRLERPRSMPISES